MRCFSCNKNFDYDKFYGICPKCGCYNKRETKEESHQRYHDAYDGGYHHREEKPASEWTRTEEKPEKSKSDGKKLLIAGFVFFLICLLLLMLVPVVTMAVQKQRMRQAAEQGTEIPMPEYEVGEWISYKGTTLRVTECRVLADSTELDLAEGMMLVGIKLEGTSDGEYEEYNRVEDPYLYANGVYRPPVSTYSFEPYSRLYGTTPLLDRYALQMEEEAAGWYVFLTEEENQEGQICFEVFEEEKAGGKLLSVETVNVTFTGQEGGAVDEES